jgi:hypothetical protein
VGDDLVPIWKVDGIRYLDSDTIVVSGDAAVEIKFSSENQPYEVALKFRTVEEDDVGVRVGNPKSNRTVVHLINFPTNGPLSSPRVQIGKIGDRDLFLAFVANPFASPSGVVWSLTYTLFAGGQ